MLIKVKNFVSKFDNFLFQKFGSDKSFKSLDNIKEAHTIFSHLNKSGEESKVRFVGGCVRKALSGEKIDDIDLATSLTPVEVKKKLNIDNIKIIDTGISHGTLTVIINKIKFEITTLRKDITTDGRHANVEFTLDWESDAARRDFTINAIYADIEGRIFDPFNGLEDLKNGKIKFIGSAEERIQEDYLRILRYFRFYVHYSKTDHDYNVIKLIKKNINGLNNISNERIFDELKKFFILKNFDNIFSNNITKEVILNIFPQFKHYERIKKFRFLNQSLKNMYDVYLILALLMMDESSDYEYFCHKYKTPKSSIKRFDNIRSNFENLKKNFFYLEENIKKQIYFTSIDGVIDLLLFSLCANNRLKNINFEKLINDIKKYKVPKFPISGELLKEYGYKTGQELGKKLKLLEEDWIKNNFVIDKNLIKKSLKK